MNERDILGRLDGWVEMRSTLRQSDRSAAAKAARIIRLRAAYEADRDLVERRTIQGEWYA